jgi:Ca2+-binding EF-hand superfamily protein
MIRRAVLVVAVLAAVGNGVLALTPATQARAAETPSEVPPDVQDLVFLGPTRPVLVRLHVTIDGEPFRTVWLRRFDESFAAEDRDGDGRLTGAEAGAVAREMKGSLSDEGEAGLKELAAEESIDRDALRARLEQALAPLVVRPRGVIGQGAALAVFPLLDDDRNRQLSADELAAAEKRLLLRDFDDNRVLTPGELIVDPEAIAEASDPNAQEKELDADKSPVMLLAGAGPWPKFAERMLARYDRSGDGKLSLAAMQGEIVLPAALANRWDEDGDALLTAAELQAASDWNPDIELKFALGTTEARRSRASRAPRNPDGFRIREKLLGGYDLDLHEAAIDFDRDNRDPRQADLIDFRNYDRDNNKYLDTNEAQAQGIGTAAFKAMDIDGDGKVFRGELTTYATRQNEAAAARLCLVVKDKGQDMFKLLEVETDGLLSQRELTAARSLLETHDADGDGTLALNEVPQLLEMQLVRGIDESTGPAMSYRFSVDNSKAQTSGPLWFRKMDRNNDGDLSPYEFIGPKSTFDRLDANGDGLVDRGEAESVTEAPSQ